MLIFYGVLTDKYSAYVFVKTFMTTPLRLVLIVLKAVNYDFISGCDGFNCYINS